MNFLVAQSCKSLSLLTEVDFTEPDRSPPWLDNSKVFTYLKAVQSSQHFRIFFSILILYICMYVWTIFFLKYPTDFNKFWSRWSTLKVLKRVTFLFLLVMKKFSKKQKYKFYRCSEEKTTYRSFSKQVRKIKLAGQSYIT